MNIRITRILRQAPISSSPRLFTTGRSARGNSYLARLRGIPQRGDDFNSMAETVPASVDVPEREALPKLSASEFRAYNSMAEHMEYFVSRVQCLTPATCTNKPSAQSLSSILEPPLRCLRIGQTPLQYIHASIPLHRIRFLLASRNAPQH